MAKKHRVLVVEDEVMIAMLLEDMLADLDCEVVETAARIEDALQYAESGNFDFAVLDVNLGGVRSYPVADSLRQRGIPVVFTTGYGAGGVDAAYAGAPILQKPFQQEALEAAVARALSTGGE
ncbi:MAG TPA: response regulator [Alphaproteobacteria bacterium]|nr:response regulator [Alphaproteobacteria bacterium]